jgi:predicted RNA-binding protein YlqC (UPF0109 family)
MDENRRSGQRYGSQPHKKGSSRRYGSGELASSTVPEDLAEYILKVLAREPDSLQFERQVPYPGRSKIAVTCDPAFTGRLIGKDGKTISALRSLVRAVANRYGKRIDIEINS